MDYLEKLLPTDGSVRIQNITTQKGVFVIAGPKSRLLLQKLTDTPLTNEKFGWLSGKTISIGYGIADALRINFVGELGWELHHPIEMQNYIFDEIMKAGEEFNIRPFGIRAMDSMRLEKSYRVIPKEMSIEYSAFESGLDRFIKLDKSSDFIGKNALKKSMEDANKNNFVTLEVLDTKDADARGSEGIFKNGELVGRATSGGFGFRINKSLALGLVQSEYSKIGEKLEIEILGNKYVANVISEAPFDPSNKLLMS